MGDELLQAREYTFEVVTTSVQRGFYKVRATDLRSALARVQAVRDGSPETFDDDPYLSYHVDFRLSEDLNGAKAL